MGLPQKNPNVTFQRVEEGAVLLSANDEVYYGLNEVGAFIWELLTPETESTDILRDALVEKYPDVDADVIAADLAEILSDLVEAGMLQNNEDTDSAK